MLGDMTHASQLDSFLIKRSRTSPWLHNFECRNSYSILIWERLWLEKFSDYNNSSDVETYPYQVWSFIQKTKKIKCSQNCIFFWGKNSGIHKTLNILPLSKQQTWCQPWLHHALCYTSGIKRTQTSIKNPHSECYTGAYSWLLHVMHIWYQWLESVKTSDINVYPNRQ